MNKVLAMTLVSLVTIGVQKKQIDWHSFVPLVTTRTEVEANLGAPSSGEGYVFIYDTADERLTVWYGGGKLSGADGCRWNIPNGTVFEFLLAPKKKVRLAEMNIDLTTFQKQKAPEMVRDYYYYNEKDGVTITSRLVEGEEVFLSIERGPTSAERARYCCKQEKGR